MGLLPGGYFERFVRWDGSDSGGADSGAGGGGRDAGGFCEVAMLSVEGSDCAEGLLDELGGGCAVG